MPPPDAMSEGDIGGLRWSLPDAPTAREVEDAEKLAQFAAMARRAVQTLHEGPGDGHEGDEP
jgi:hypothetical protein